MSDLQPVDFAVVLDHLSDGLYIADRTRRIVFWNRAAERLTGYAASEVVGQIAERVLSPVSGRGGYAAMGESDVVLAFLDHHPRSTVVFLKHRDGHRIPVDVRIKPWMDGSGRILGAVHQFNDSGAADTQYSRMAGLSQRSLLDPVTHLPNRDYLESELVSQFALLARSGVGFGVVLLSVDQANRFDDRLCDVILQTVGRTCAASVRPYDIVGRWAQDEFLGVFPNTDALALDRIAFRICQMVRKSEVTYGDRLYTVTVSAGASIATDGDTVSTLTGRANALVRMSRRRGSDRLTSDRRTIVPLMPSERAVARGRHRRVAGEAPADSQQS